MRIDGTRFEEARSDDAGQPNAEGAGFKGAGLIEMDETFYERVYEQVRKVPSGSVSAYGTIAELAGYPRASREVGYAMSRAQRAWELPCHRIVNAKGDARAVVRVRRQGEPACAAGSRGRGLPGRRHHRHEASPLAAQRRT